MPAASGQRAHLVQVILGPGLGVLGPGLPEAAHLSAQPYKPFLVAREIGEKNYWLLEEFLYL
jgi:hypothetical protein